MRCTIFDLNASLYSVIIRLFSASCNVPPDNLPERIKRGDNYPDAGGLSQEACGGVTRVRTLG